MTIQPVEHTSLQLPPEDRELEEVVIHLEREAKDLPTDQRAKFMAHVRSLAGQILMQIREIRLRGCSGEALKQESTKLYSQLKVSGEQFLEECRQSEMRFQEQHARFDSFEERLAKMALQPKEFVALTPLEELDFDAMVHGVFKMELEEHMGAVRLMAAAVEAGAELIGGVVEDACNRNERNKKACAVIKEEAAKIGAFIARDACEVFPDACKAVQDIGERLSNHALAHELEDHFGIPLAQGIQYERDGQVVALALLPVPPIAKAARARAIVPKAIVPARAGVQHDVLRDMGMHFRQLQGTFDNYLQRQAAAKPHTPQLFVLEQMLREEFPTCIPALTPEKALAHHMRSGEQFGMSRIAETSNGLFYRTTGTQKSLVIIKAADDSILTTSFGLLQLRNRKFTHLNVPKLEAFGEGWLAMSDMGESLDRIMKVYRSESDIYFKTGQGIAELHATERIAFSPGHPIQEKFICEVTGKLADMQFDGLKYPHWLTAEKIECTLKKHPAVVGLTHGDIHLGNLAWDPKNKQIGLVDLEFFLNGLTIEGKPCSFPALEFARVLHDIQELGLEAKLTKAEIKALSDAFEQGYKSIYKDLPPEVEKICKGVYGLE